MRRLRFPDGAEVTVFAGQGDRQLAVVARPDLAPLDRRLPGGRATDLWGNPPASDPPPRLAYVEGTQADLAPLLERARPR